MQILNPRDNPKRKQLLEKELKRLISHFQQLAWQSHTILSGVKEVQQRKLLEQKIRGLQS